MQWQNIDGYDWGVLDAPGTGQMISLTLGYGLMHEPISEYGTLQQAAGMLQAEMSRPVEIGPGRAGVPEVNVSVGSDTTSIVLVGEVATLRAGLCRLADLFAGTLPIALAPGVRVEFGAAPLDVTTRFGLSSLTLATVPELDVQVPRDPLRLLGELNPPAGLVQAVMFTTVPELAEPVFKPLGAVPSWAPERSRYRADAQPGELQFRAGYPLVSVTVPNTADGDAAVQVLAQQLAQHVGEVTGRDLRLEVAITPVGPDVLATIMTSDTVLYGSQRTEIHRLLHTRPIPDHRVTDAVTWQLDNVGVSRRLGRRANGLADEPPTTDDTWGALAKAIDTMRYFTDPQSQVPDGVGQAHPELPEADGRTFKAKGARDRVVVGDAVIERHRPGSHGIASTIERVCVDRLALVIEDPSDAVILVDEDYHNLEVIYDIYRGQSRLRELIAQRTAAVPRITARNAVQAQRVRQQAGRSRLITAAVVLAPIAVILFAVLMSWAEGLREVGEPAPEHLEAPTAVAEEPQREETRAQAAVGETMTLSNWSRITVANVAAYEPAEDSEFAPFGGLHLAADVEFCAAEEPATVDPEKFQMYHDDPAQPAHVVTEIEDRLETRELTAGQCATGQLGFFALSEQPADLTIVYGDYPDRLFWAVETWD